MTAKKAEKLTYAPVIEEAPVNIECVVTKIEKLGSHHMFLAEVKAVQVDESLLASEGGKQSQKVQQFSGKYAIIWSK